ncbi:MAG: VIT domain-containing protein [Anaerolineae bacterium]
MTNTRRPISAAARRALVFAAAAASVLLPLAHPVLADGIIIPEPPPGPQPPALRETWLTIRYHRVSVSIDHQIAVTRVEQEFVNEHDWEAEGTYVFPLPEGAAVSAFTMWVDGEPVEGKILDADEARRIYEDVVRRQRDPALLEYVGRNAVKARIFPIPPRGSRKIELEYTQVLPIEDGLVRYVYPLETEKFSARPLEECSVRVDIRSDEAMHAIYSPTHQDRLFVERDGDYRAAIGYEETHVLPDQDFELVYTVSQDEVGLNLLTYPEAEDRGFFLLLAAPTVEVGQERVIPRDIVLVLDTSGSMEGEKLVQAKGALRFVLEHLNEEDRFNVIAFSTGLSRYARGLRAASEGGRAIRWVQDLDAVGGTNINQALLEALSLVEGGQGTSARPAVLIFLTDGLPTEGVTEIDRILANVAAAAPDHVRLFSFGVGDDVNTVLLDTLAEQNRGTTGYVRPGERIDERVSALYAKIKTPVLTDVELDFGDVMADDVYPSPLPDLFAGSQLIVTGRYRLFDSYSSERQIVLTGQVDGERREFVYRGAFGAGGGDDGPAVRAMDFIPRLWATRKIGHLLTQIRLHGEKEEWVEAVVDLSVAHGIVTPYTSFLIEEEDILTDAGRERAAWRVMMTPAPAASGAPAVEMAEDQAKLRAAESSAPSMPADGAASGEGAARAVRHVGAKTFVLEDGVWMDTAFNPDTMSTVPIAFGSDAYFDLLRARPAWGEYLALGDRVIFVVDEAGGPTVYEVVEEGQNAPQTTAPDTSTAAPPTSETIEPEQGDVEPSPTPAESPPAPSSAVCPGAMALSAVALAAVIVWESWPRSLSPGGRG